jgi:hypothetical protein
MKIIHTLWQNKELREWAWKMFNALVAMVLAWLSTQTTWDFVVVALIARPIVEAISKHINKQYGDLWVDKPIE